MEQFSNSIVDISYQQTGTATSVNSLGMREMQAMAYEARNERFLLIKAPPASGKSRALMYIALDKLANQGIKRVIVAVPEKSIGRSFKNTNLTNNGFFADWTVAPYFNLTDVKNENDKNKDQNKDNNQNQERPQDGQMSKENAEQLLNAAVQEEKATQQRLQKAMAQPRRRNIEKNW